MSDVTQILNQIQQGDPRAAEQLLPLIYDELRKLAAVRMAQESPDQTLQATALVHEAYLRLVDDEKTKNWNNRGHFFGAAAEAMRRILIDRARQKQRPKHGGDLKRVELDQACSMVGSDGATILAVNAALEQLALESPQKAELVKLRYFAGLTIEEAAQVLGISRTTASRHWSYAKVFLYCELEDRK